MALFTFNAKTGKSSSIEQESVKEQTEAQKLAEKMKQSRGERSNESAEPESRGGGKPVNVKKPKVVEKDPLDVDHIFEKKQETKSFTKNATLNDMLNETAQSGEWRNMDGGPRVFNSSHAQGFGSMMNPQSSVLQTPEGGQVSTQELQKTEAGQAVVSALTRDYSGLMKAINTKKGK